MSAPRRQGQHGARIDPPRANLLRIEKEFRANLLRIEKEPRTNLLRIEKDPFRILAGNGVSLLHYPAFLYQKLACFQMFFMQMLIYYLFIEMKTALTVYLLHYIVALVEFSPASCSYKPMRV